MGDSYTGRRVRVGKPVVILEIVMVCQIGNLTSFGRRIRTTCRARTCEEST